ncbi:extracellular catalytic domain type 2 short-chain-length polyhydroxyalkanoate depolymerase [Lacimicrobium alkaliphilum]|uniref:Depolymerase n=1 Tax=Lacimicrobium alkaliphilum TaxID=1526571 RepID=A0ABQ1RPZ9_9ALTE|nr:PHB depolymerase family esterase [Lacimicrobium alkaliphilum]GGD74223.1 depolymerase [Lacimicrobium alkaliphilum]
MKTLIMAVTLAASSQSIAETPALDLNIETLSVSGISSGGYMAGQFHIAHSDWVSGIGIIAGGPYYCARNSIMTALGQCVNKQDDAIDLAELKTTVNEWQKQGLISSVDNIQGDKVWILHGTEDKKVLAEVTDQLVEQYQHWAGAENVRYVNNKPFAHHFPTEKTGTACDVSEIPFIASCGYNAASEMMQHIAATPEQQATSKGRLFTVDQQELGGDDASGLADSAYLYAPAPCLQGESCQVHVSFHGCNQNIEAVGDDYARLTGLNEWADFHNTVVLYPQTKKSTLMPLNPQACWDWWGYTDENYANQQGKQIKAVTNMIRNLAGE